MAPNQEFSSSSSSSYTSSGFESSMISDITLLIEIEGKEEVGVEERDDKIGTVWEAKCECCGMCEEWSNEYIRGVRDMFMGKLICGLCAAAVTVEMEKNGGEREKAVEEHMSDCVKFNSLVRSYPALYRAKDVKEILRKTQKKRAMFTTPKDSNTLY